MADGTTTQMMIDYHRARDKRRSIMRNSLTLDALEGKSSHQETALQSTVAGDLEIPNFCYSHGSPARPTRRKLHAATDEFLEDLTKQASKRLGTEEAAAQIDKLLQKHRSMQVAEEGFLPRNRRPASLQLLGKSFSYSHDGDFGPCPLPSPALTAANLSTKNSPDASPVLLCQAQSLLSHPSSDIDSSPPHLLHEALRSSPHPHVVPSSPDSDDSSIQGSDAFCFASNEQAVEHPNGPPLPEAFTPKRESQVLRKVNSGFEIMVPGTFAPLTVEDALVDSDGGNRRRTRRLQKVPPSSHRRSRASLDLDKHEAVQPIEDDAVKRRPKRLQKKRRHSTSSIA